MLAPSVAIPMIVVKSPLKNVATDSPECFAIGWMLWPVGDLFVVFGTAGFVNEFVCSGVDAWEGVERLA